MAELVMRMSKLAVIRVRGGVDVREEIKDTLKMLKLTRPNHCRIVKDDSSLRGMLDKAKEMVTWGDIKPEVLEKLLSEKGEFRGGKPVNDERVKENTPYEDVNELTEAVLEEEYELSEIDGLNEVFRLHPPKKGFKSTAQSYGEGGAMGDRGEEINDLILRMM